MAFCTTFLESPCNIRKRMVKLLCKTVTVALLCITLHTLFIFRAPDECAEANFFLTENRICEKCCRKY